jgi:hypothetical protein
MPVPLYVQRKFHAFLLYIIFKGKDYLLKITTIMKTIRLLTFSSLDGYPVYPAPDNIMYLRNFNLKSHLLQGEGPLIISGEDYAEIFQRNAGWPFTEIQTYVISSSDMNVTPEAPVIFITENPVRTLHKLKHENSSGCIFVITSGIGTGIISFLLKNKLLDEMHLITLPIVLGSDSKASGLFDNVPYSEWKLSSSTAHPSGVLETFYRRIQS